MRSPKLQTYLTVTCLFLLVSCGIPGKSGPAGSLGPAGKQGPIGSPGPPGAEGGKGKQGIQGPVGQVDPKEVRKTTEAIIQRKLLAFQQKLDALQKKLDKLTSCPSGMAAISGYCIDKYEASLDKDSKVGSVHGRNTTAKAVSRVNLPRKDISWFQAARACQNAGKRLCSRQEWLLAASGTPDTGSGRVGTQDCNIRANGSVATGSRKNCKSSLGVFDTTGNLAEWTDEWYITGSPMEVDQKKWEGALIFQPWAGISRDGKDATWNVNARAFTDLITSVGGLPAAAVRGGHFENAEKAGRLALDLRFGPMFRSSKIGFRCCRDRAVLSP